MTTSTRRSGFSLIELMVGLAAAALLSAAAVQFFAGQAGFTRQVALQTDLADRGRVVRDAITNDITRAGSYWSHEMHNGASPMGVFGSACRGTGINANWPQFPITGSSGGIAGTDALSVIVPYGMVVPVSVSGTTSCASAGTRANYKLSTGADIQLMHPGLAEYANPAGWSAGVIYMVSGSGYTLFTTRTAVAGTNNCFIDVNEIPAGNVGQCGWRDLTLWGGGPGTSAANEDLPGSTNPAATNFSDPEGGLVMVPIKGIVYVVHTAVNPPVLYRCATTNPANGPGAVTTGAIAAGTAWCHKLMEGVEDLQIRYVFLDVDATGATTDSCFSNNPLTVTTTGTNPSCGNKAAPATGAFVRFIAVQVGIVMRALKPDGIRTRNRGHQIPLFDHTTVAAGTDSYRRTSFQWDVTVPATLVY